jgi:hypothetical protein
VSVIYSRLIPGFPVVFPFSHILFSSSSCICTSCGSSINLVSVASSLHRLQNGWKTIGTMPHKEVLANHRVHMGVTLRAPAQYALPPSQTHDIGSRQSYRCTVKARPLLYPLPPLSHP